MIMKNINNKQNIEIATLKTEFIALKERLDKFIDNEFCHLRARVDYILWILILGTLITIAIGLFK